MPEPMRALGDAALKRIRKNGAIPMVWEMPDEKGVDDKLAQNGGSGWFACPYAAQDHDRWFALMMGIFGTRQEVVGHVFMNQLSELCNRNWKAPPKGGWFTDEGQLMQLLAIINDLRPRNAAEAALAAQLCALHLSAMKLGHAVASTWGGDGRTAAVLAKTTRAYADGLKTLEALKGRGNKSRQMIKVEKHTHTHQHIHIEEGSARNGEQPYGRAARAIAELRSLPSPQPVGFALSRPGNEGKAGMPNPRGRKSRRTEGES